VALPPGVTALSLDALSAKVMAASPQASTLAGLSLSSNPGSSVLFNLGKDGVAYMNPYTGEFLGRGAPRVRGFFEWTEGVHRWFGFEGAARETARQVKGIVTLLFGFMVLTGFILWWPRKWSLTALKSVMIPTFKNKKKARDWNQHNAVGFWSAPWLLVIILTGLVMAYPWANDLLYRLTGNAPPPRSTALSAPHPDGKEAHAGKKGHEVRRMKKLKGVSLDQVLEAVNQQAPGWKSINLRLPQKANPNFVIQVQEGTSFRAFTRSMLTLDAVTGDVIKWEPYESQNLGRKLRLWARFVHTGEAGGAVGQTLAALAAMGALWLVWTGFAMAWWRFTGPGES